MKALCRAAFLACCLLTLCSPAMPQKAVAPPPKPADSGPSPAVTMQFIQDKMNDQGQVGYVLTRSDLAVTYRYWYAISDVRADPSACTLTVTETTVWSIEPAEGHTYNEGGKPVIGEDLNRRSVDQSTSSFRDVGTITVEGMQESDNRQTAENAHPEITFTVTPTVFTLRLHASKPLFSFHNSYTQGKDAAKVNNVSGKDNIFTFRDEDTANRVAKAMLHAVELCGGGNKDPF